MPFRVASVCHSERTFYVSSALNACGAAVRVGAYLLHVSHGRIAGERGEQGDVRSSQLVRFLRYCAAEQAVEES